MLCMSIHTVGRSYLTALNILKLEIVLEYIHGYIYIYIYNGMLFLNLSVVVTTINKFLTHNPSCVDMQVTFCTTPTVIITEAVLFRGGNIRFVIWKLFSQDGFYRMNSRSKNINARLAFT